MNRWMSLVTALMIIDEEEELTKDKADKIYECIKEAMRIYVEPTKKEKKN